MFNVNGKKAIITGGAQGLGFSMTEAFHNAGVEIAVIDISDEISNVASKLKANDAKIHGDKGAVQRLHPFLPAGGFL